MKLKVKIYFLAVLVQCACTLSAWSAPKHPHAFTLAYKDLPFGKTEWDIVNWLELQDNVVVYEDRSVNINQFMCYQPIAPFFSSGIKKTEEAPQFYNYFVKKYVVERCGSIFPNTFRVDLYFVRDDGDVYKLFMVHRVCGVEAGVMEDIYSGELRARTKEYGEPAQSWQTFSSGSTIAANERQIPAYVTIWQQENGSIFFMMADNGMLQFREFLFVWSPGWGMYQKALEKARAWR